ncbi:hypothetical protein Ddye_007491, partial [Dipteronia dyeriana]
VNISKTLLHLLLSTLIPLSPDNRYSRSDSRLSLVFGSLSSPPSGDLISIRKSISNQESFVHYQSCKRNSNLRFLKDTMSSGPGLESLVDQTISVITNDGRNIVGILKGFDQATNIILDESHERVYSTKEGVQQLVLGLYIIRGDNISIVGELDEELDSHLDLSNLRAHPLKPVIH